MKWCKGSDRFLSAPAVLGLGSGSWMLVLSRSANDRDKPEQVSSRCRQIDEGQSVTVVSAARSYIPYLFRVNGLYSGGGLDGWMISSMECVAPTGPICDDLIDWLIILISCYRPCSTIRSLLENSWFLCLLFGFRRVHTSQVLGDALIRWFIWSF